MVGRTGIQRIRYSQWSRSALWAIGWIFLWLLAGHVLSCDFIDNNYSASFPRLSNYEGALSYIGAVIAIQIPIFILLLERIYQSGPVWRFISLHAVFFREIIVSYIVLSFLLVISHRAAFYYIPVIGITAVSFCAVYQSFAMLFESRMATDRAKRYVRKIIQGRIHVDKNIDEENSRFLRDVESLSYIKYRASDLWAGEGKDENVVPVFSPSSGVVRNINVKRLDSLLSSLVKGVVNSPDENPLRNDNTLPIRLVLDVAPGESVNEGDGIARFILKDVPVAHINLLQRKVPKCISFDPAMSIKKSINESNEFMMSLDQQLRDDIKKGDRYAIEMVLELRRAVTEELISGYERVGSLNTFTGAKEEMDNSIWGINVSVLRKVLDLSSDTFAFALRLNNREAADALVSDIYKGLLGVRDASSTALAAVCAEMPFMRAMGVVVRADEVEVLSISHREYLLRMFVLLVQEHTMELVRLSTYERGEIGIAKDIAKDWLESRLNETTLLLVDAYKRSDMVAFTELKSIFDTVEDRRNVYRSSAEPFVLSVWRGLFLAAAYMQGRDECTEVQKEMQGMLNSHLRSKLSLVDLTKLMIDCIDNDYARRWKFHLIDMIPDGKMRNFPDFAANMRAVWIEAVLARRDGIPTLECLVDKDYIKKTRVFAGVYPYEESPIERDLEKRDKRLSGVKTLINLVQRLADAHKQYEQDTVSGAALDSAIIQNFRKEVNKGYERSAQILSLIMKPLPSLDSNGRIVGINQAWDKRAFISGEHFIRNGHEYGDSVANYQDRLIINSLFDEGRDRIRSIDGFGEWIDRLRKAGGDWLIVSTDDIYHYCDRIQDFSCTKIVDDGSKAYFKTLGEDSPIIEIYDNDKIGKGLYAISVDKLGELKIASGGDGLLDVRVDAYSSDEALRNNMLESPPDWLREMGDRSRQEAFLKTQVRVLIQQTFQYEPPEDVEMYYLPVNGE